MEDWKGDDVLLFKIQEIDGCGMKTKKNLHNEFNFRWIYLHNTAPQN